MAESTATLRPRPAPDRTDTPPGGPSPDRAPGRHRRTALLVVLLAAALLVPAARALPGLLVSWAPAGLRFSDGAPAAVVDQFGGPEGTYVVGYEHGRSLSLEVDLAATGLVGAQVTDATLVTQARPLLVRTGPAEVHDGAGSDASVRLPVRFENCEAYHEREAMLVHHVDVHLQALGRAFVERVPLDRPMMVRSPMLWECPDRTIDRSDDLRGPVR